MGGFVDDGEYFDDLDDEPCWNCGGEGYVASCDEQWACLHPDEGCDLCIRQCDFCVDQSKDNNVPADADLPT